MLQNRVAADLLGGHVLRGAEEHLQRTADVLLHAERDALAELRVRCAERVAEYGRPLVPWKPPQKAKRNAAVRRKGP